MAKRKGLSKKTRFEVFKRDSFTCQYCGKAAPDVVLQCDHIAPVAKGGEDDIMNLVTSCTDCNAGKSDRTLDDASVIARQRDQLAQLNERREQLEMMLQWREGLQSINEDVLEKAIEYWNDKTPGFHVAESGERQLCEVLKKAGMSIVLDAMDTATANHLRHNADGSLTAESVEAAFRKMQAIAKAKHGDQKNPGTSDRAYIRGILKNRLGYINDRSLMPMLKEAMGLGIDADDIKDLAKEVGSWTQFRTRLEEWIEAEGGRHEAQDF
jgi:hypothetical protein